MKRYQEKHVKIWEEGTWVVCPECHNSAVITPGGHLVHCCHCGYEKKSEDQLSFTAVIKLNCPNCGAAIHNEQHGIKNKMDKVFFKCPNCSFSSSTKPHYKEIYNPINPNEDGLRRDCIFGLPYFFQENVRENLELVKEIWPPIIKLAEVCDVKIAIENCPMLFGEEQWPGGQNLMTTPPIWREVFKILDSDNLGINYDPSHFIWQMIDYIRPLYEFKDKLFHVHYKDIKIYRDKLESCGIMAYPLEYMSPKIPGLGDVDWGKYVSALTDIGYDGCTCIEIEDKAFEDSKEKVEKSLILSKRYIEKYVI